MPNRIEATADSLSVACLFRPPIERLVERHCRTLAWGDGTVPDSGSGVSSSAVIE